MLRSPGHGAISLCCLICDCYSIIPTQNKTQNSTPLKQSCLHQEAVVRKNVRCKNCSFLQNLWLGTRDRVNRNGRAWLSLQGDSKQALQ